MTQRFTPQASASKRQCQSAFIEPMLLVRTNALPDGGELAVRLHRIVRPDCLPRVFIWCILDFRNQIAARRISLATGELRKVLGRAKKLPTAVDQQKLKLLTTVDHQKLETVLDAWSL